MSTLVVKNLPDALHERLRVQAAEHRRSVTKETIHLLEQGLLEGSRRVPLLLSPPYVLRSGPMNIEQIEAAINDGRD